MLRRIGLEIHGRVLLVEFPVEVPLDQQENELVKIKEVVRAWVELWNRSGQRPLRGVGQ